MCSPDSFRRGEPNTDGQHNIADPVFILRYLFTGGAMPTCLKTADADDTGNTHVTDAVSLLGCLFLGCPSPAEPVPTYGFDPTIDKLTCESFVGCR
jgi:hypothetical protein